MNCTANVCNYQNLQGVCPACGYCPCCGRKNASPYFQPWPNYPQPYIGDWPYGQGVTTITGTAIGGMVGQGVQFMGGNLA